MADLNDLTPDVSGWELRRATDLNDFDQIVGFGAFNGQVHGFLLTPISQTIPSTRKAKVSGSGTIGTSARKATFAFSVKTDTEGVCNGQLSYRDSANGISIRSTTITALVVTNEHAQIFGNALTNGSQFVDFVVNIDGGGREDEVAQPNHNFFQIRLSGAYLLGGSIEDGKIQVR